MLNKIEIKPHKGLVGSGRPSKTPPYREVERSPKSFLFGEDSYFITPKDEAKRELCPDGMKR